jgi:hypothetical protein
VTLARFRKPKATCFLSYVEYREKYKHQQYYEKQGMLYKRGRVKEGS